MQHLGDAFSDQDKSDLITRNFQTGRVFYLQHSFTTGPRDKYSLLICPNDPPLWLLFNSGMARFIEDNPSLKACQVEIKQAIEPTAVAKDCFLDCTDVKSVKAKDVEKQVKDDPSRVRGLLSQGTLKEVYLALSKDKRIPLGQKVRMLEALRPFTGFGTK